jgi:copper homeostasis protein (lipoprotein)
MRITIAVALLWMLVGCAREEPAPESTAPEPRTELDATPTPDTATPVSIDPLPARYSGVLPCADCPGIRYDIDLRPANIYFLRMTYLNTAPERTYDDIGAWSFASDLHTLALRGSRQLPLLFAIGDAASLRKLDSEGQPIESELNYTLKRIAPYTPLSPQVPLRGMYSRVEGGAIVEECTTGLKLSLAGATIDALAQEFASLRKGSDRPMLVAVEGRIDAPPTEGEAATLNVTSTAKFWPGESCGARGVTHDLEGSRWVLVRLGDQPVMPEEGKPEPYIVLQSSTKEVAGHGGCNRLSGGYAIKGDTLQLSELTTTRMACPEIQTEHAFLNALESVARWRLMDNQLVLLDKNNVAVLQLESRNL